MLRAQGEAGMRICTWGLLPKTRQWDEVPLPRWVVEVYPRGRADHGDSKLVERDSASHPVISSLTVAR